jgi:hypothetical protein
MPGTPWTAALSGRGFDARRGVLLATTCLVAAGLGHGVATAATLSIFKGNVAVSVLTYQGIAATVPLGHPLPNTNGAVAIADGAYPHVFLNDGPDSNFGVTAPYSLRFYASQTGATATLRGSFKIPSYYVKGASSGFFTGSFSSKSEGSINISADGNSLTMMGYDAPVDAIDASNANTSVSTETGNTDIAPNANRTVVQVNSDGSVVYTDTTAYPGNNPRAVVLAPDGNYYMAGNGGNGNGDGNIGTLTGVQKIAPGALSPASQQIGAFNVTSVGLPADKKPFKDNNFRGETLFNNTLFVTKGSGSNGMNTVYQVGPAGAFAGGAGITTGAATVITPLPGFPIQAAKSDANFFPFGIWFANATTLYVADEGDGTLATAATNANAGLEKWIYSSVDSQWRLAYVLQAGLQLGTPYTVSGKASHVTGSYTTETGGLRNITGRTNKDGTVTIFAITSTVSDTSITGDQGADPNRLVAITDNPAFATAADASAEQFSVLATASYGEVMRGVAMVRCRAQKNAPCD